MLSKQVSQPLAGVYDTHPQSDVLVALPPQYPVQLVDTALRSECLVHPALIGEQDHQPAGGEVVASLSPGPELLDTALLGQRVNQLRGGRNVTGVSPGLKLVNPAL